MGGEGGDVGAEREGDEDVEGEGVGEEVVMVRVVALSLAQAPLHAPLPHVEPLLLSPHLQNQHTPPQTLQSCTPYSEYLSFPSWLPLLLSSLRHHAYQFQGSKGAFGGCADEVRGELDDRRRPLRRGGSWRGRGRGRRGSWLWR
ncbi:hypothetical protein PIB30_024457 [Stylosanthes scabra]|uniref:Uncharacterized protein n=1 Tax=Stylosanthes scabra TaxID=79078 RepID=A0ABU6X8Y4_9FABA|nr:hypothetical protein [Stylosanthes scabra]